MTSSKAIFALLQAVVVAVGVVVFGAAQASASSKPIVIPYAKTCDEIAGHCVGSAGDGGSSDAGHELPGHGQCCPADADRVDHGRRHLVHSRDERAYQPGWVHRAERHGHGGLVRGRACRPAKQLHGPRGRRPEHGHVDRRAPAHAGECLSRITDAGGAGWIPALDCGFAVGVVAAVGSAHASPRSGALHGTKACLLAIQRRQQEISIGRDFRAL